MRKYPMRVTYLGREFDLTVCARMNGIEWHERKHLPRVGNTDCGGNVYQESPGVFLWIRVHPHRCGIWTDRVFAVYTMDRVF